MNAMKHTLTAFVAIVAAQFLCAAPVLAQNTGEIKGTKLNTYLLSIIDFINVVLVPLIFALAFIVFIWGMFQYFIAGGASEETRDKGKQLAMWGIIAFVVMVSIWGIINVFASTLFTDQQRSTRPALPTFKASMEAPSVFHT